MGRMNVLMMGVLAAATVVADDGRDYRICGLDDDGRLTLVESRKREVRPVVALPVEEAPLATAVFKTGEKLDEFDCEALEHHIGAVRIDAGEDGAASEVYLNGLKLKDFLARERKFRPPVAKCGFSSWADAETFAAPIASNDLARTHADFVSEIGDIVMDEFYRPIAASEDGTRVNLKTVAEVITNDVLVCMSYEQPLLGAIDVVRSFVAIERALSVKIESPKSNPVKLHHALWHWSYPEHRSAAEQRVIALENELDAGPGDPFVQMLLAQALLNFHIRPRSNVVQASDATNISRRVTALAERYALSPVRTRFAFEQVRNIVSKPADAGTHAYGFSLDDRRYLVGCLRSSKADPWVADVFEGFLELDLAWYGKGDMYQYSPQPDWMEKVYPHLKAARVLFHRAWQRHPELPEGAFGMLCVEWELHHWGNAARWLGQLWDAELDAPWMDRLIRNRLLSWFPEEKASYGKVRKLIAERANRNPKRMTRSPDADGKMTSGSSKAVIKAFYRGDDAPRRMALDKSWKNGSFQGMGSEAGVAPYKDVGKVLKMTIDSTRRERLWPIYWDGCLLPGEHEGEIDVEFSAPEDPFAFIAFGFLFSNAMEGQFVQVTRKGGKSLFEGYRTCLGEPEVYPFVYGDKASVSSLSPDVRRFLLRYRIANGTLCAWVDGKLDQPLMFIGKGGQKKDYRPAFLGTGVKIHAIRYRQIPPNAGLEEFVR